MDLKPETVAVELHPHSPERIALARADADARKAELGHHSPPPQSPPVRNSGGLMFQACEP
ncbi:MAG TPA: hypothetical protein VKR31_14910 [Rhizomicrobium sp.]|nr:hypothetical protein [Rhizomicrobium sp.]